MTTTTRMNTAASEMVRGLAVGGLEGLHVGLLEDLRQWDPVAGLRHREVDRRWDVVAHLLREALTTFQVLDLGEISTGLQEAGTSAAAAVAAAAAEAASVITSVPTGRLPVATSTATAADSRRPPHKLLYPKMLVWWHFGNSWYIYIIINHVRLEKGGTRGQTTQVLSNEVSLH